MVNGVPRRQDRLESRALCLENLAVHNGPLALLGPMFVDGYFRIICKEIDYPACVVLVPVREKDMGDGDIVVFEISRHIQCPLRSSL